MAGKGVCHSQLEEEVVGRATQDKEQSNRFRFTRRSVDSIACPAGKAQALYRDTEQPALMLRVTARGTRSFIFEQRLAGRTVRVTIGSATMQIRAPKDRAGRPLGPGADVEAARLASLVSRGIDPRIDKAATVAEQQLLRNTAKVERARLAVSGLAAWAQYLEDRRPHWGDLNYADHRRFAAAGGEPRQRSKIKTTQPGALHDLLNRPLASIDAILVEQWAANETRRRPTSAALGFRMLRAFVNWCAEHPDYSALVHADACKTKRAREKLARPVARDDALQREQLRAWFAAVRQDANPTIAAYLQMLLLTGARREELAGLRWEDVDFRWKSLRIRDKVEGERVIPLTTYVATLLQGLRIRNGRPPVVPRRIRNDLDAVHQFRSEWEPSVWVFASRQAAGGRVRDPRRNHMRALATAGLPHISLHGLRRSFGTLAEWVECPTGVVAQIMGHKPSAIAEKHYRVRPLDLLRMWHERIEAWILAEAGIELSSIQETVKRMVISTSSAAGSVLRG